jgi:hypothetical protein
MVHRSTPTDPDNGSMDSNPARKDEQAEGESSSAFFERLRPRFLDWTPPTEEEKARELYARWQAREAELRRVTELAAAKEAERAAIRKRRQEAAERAKAEFALASKEAQP